MGLQLGRALLVVRQTLPYVVFRAAAYGGLCLGAIIYLGFLAVIGAVFGAGAFWVLLVISVGLAALLGIGNFVGEYIFYRLKAGHIALITEVIAEGQLPVGISQMKWARGRVMHYFHGMALLPEVRRLLRETIRAVDRTLFDSSAVLPMPGIEGGTTLAQRVVGFSQAYVEEAAIAYVFKTRDENVFAAAKDAVLLYCQAWKPLLANAVTLSLLSYAFTLAASVMFLMPLGIIALLISPHGVILRFVLFATGVFLGFAAKWALFDPVACASITIAFLKESEITTPDPKWEQTLAQATDAFAELKRRAEE